LWAGRYSDTRGARSALIAGLLIAAVSGLFYLLSLKFTGTPPESVAILIGGRAALGVAESFILTGALNCGLARFGVGNTGKAMALVGTALYAAFAVGAPIGTVLFDNHGFTAIALAATFIPLITVLFALRLDRVAPTTHAPADFLAVVRAVWAPGVALALSAVGFGAVTTFVTLLFVDRGWSAAWLAFSVLSAAFIVGRLAFGHLPDRVGGAKVALVCVLVEAVGQALLWLAPWRELAVAGAALTGLGYSLIYPGLGMEAIRRAPPQSRGLATGAYTAFLDIALGVTGPALGLVASAAGMRAVYFAGMLVVLSSAVFVLWLASAGAPRAAAQEN
jgi:MFS family permease